MTNRERLEAEILSLLASTPRPTGLWERPLFRSRGAAIGDVVGCTSTQAILALADDATAVEHGGWYCTADLGRRAPVQP